MMARGEAAGAFQDGTLQAGASQAGTSQQRGYGHAPPSEASKVLIAIVRRYLLLAQLPAAEWSRNEAALLLLTQSILSRFVCLTAHRAAQLPPSGLFNHRRGCSSLSCAANMATEEAVIEAIKKRLASHASGAPSGGADRLGRLSECLEGLKKKVRRRHKGKAPPD